MNKEEMKRRLEENVEPKYNKQRNLEEIKSNLTFTNEKEIMESMDQINPIFLLRVWLSK